jgi:hypothetical protein
MYLCYENLAGVRILKKNLLKRALHPAILKGKKKGRNTALRIRLETCCKDHACH